MSINEAVADALTDYAVAWRDSEGVACIKIATELGAAIEQHVAEAVKAEREVCADIAREWEDVFVIEDSAPRHVDEVIRARGTP